jgi:integrase
VSVYKSKKSPFYWYDFECRGGRFFGSTKRTTKREAEEVERHERERAKRATKASLAAATSLQLDHIAGRYWDEVGQHHAGADNTDRDLARLVQYFGKTKLLTEITDDDVAKLVAWRRGHRVIRSPKTRVEDTPLVSNATVNRSTTETLKKLFTRAKRSWGLTFEREPNWRAHMLPEPEERVRELHGDEAERLDDAMRDDYAPFFAFAKASGLRLDECFLKWPEVNFSTRQITTTGKGGKRITVPITSTIREVLWPLQGQHTECVFTYVAERYARWPFEG